MSSSAARQNRARGRVAPGALVLPLRPAPVESSSNITNNITNNIANNVVNVTIVQQPLPGLVASLQNPLNQTLRIDPALSILAADGATTLEDTLADELIDQSADIEAALRAQGLSKPISFFSLTESVRSQYGMQNPERTINNVTVKVALVAIPREGPGATPTTFLKRTRIVLFKAEELTSIRFLCVETLLASSVHGLHNSAYEPWTQLKELLMVYLPGHNWQRWIVPSETVFAEWYEDYVTRRHIQDIHMRVGVDEETAARLGAMEDGRPMEAATSRGETVKVLTEGTEWQDGVERDY